MKWCCFICLPDDELCYQLVSQKEEVDDMFVRHQTALEVDDRVAYSPTMYALRIQEIIFNLLISIGILHRVIYLPFIYETLVFAFRERNKICSKGYRTNSWYLPTTSSTTFSNYYYDYSFLDHI